MLHNLNDVARSRFLDADAFREYAQKCKPNMLIDDEYIDTWHVDDLVHGFIDYYGHHRYLNYRAEQIKQITQPEKT